MWATSQKSKSPPLLCLHRDWREAQIHKLFIVSLKGLHSIICDFSLRFFTQDICKSLSIEHGARMHLAFPLDFSPRIIRQNLCFPPERSFGDLFILLREKHRHILSGGPSGNFSSEMILSMTFTPRNLIYSFKFCCKTISSCRKCSWTSDLSPRAFYSVLSI